MFKSILVATDFSESSEAAMRRALELAALTGSRLHVMNVILDPSSLPWSAEAFAIPLGDLIAQWQDEARRTIERDLPEEARAAAIVVTPVGSPFTEIVSYATANHIDLIAMGTHGRGALAHLVLGSVAERVVRHAPCAVLTVRRSAAA